MSKSFSAQVDEHIRKCKLRMEAVVKTAAQAVIHDANLDGPSVARPDGGKGGRLPIDTRFLKNSLVAAIGQVPSGPSAPGKDEQGNPKAVDMVIANMKIGDTLYAGWSASYAQKMEARYGFRDAAVQKWPQQVAAAVAEVKRRIP